MRWHHIKKSNQSTSPWRHLTKNEPRLQFSTSLLCLLSLCGLWFLTCLSSAVWYESWSSCICSVFYLCAVSISLTRTQCLQDGKTERETQTCILALPGLHKWLEKFMNVEVPVADFLSIVMVFPILSCLT